MSSSSSLGRRIRLSDFGPSQMNLYRSATLALSGLPMLTALKKKMGPKSIPTSNLGLGHRNNKSFRNLPHAVQNLPNLSAPVGSILSEVRAQPNVSRGPQPFSTPSRRDRHRDTSKQRSFSQMSRGVLPTSVTKTKGGTMTRGNSHGTVARMDTLTWLNSVKVGERREGSSETGSGIESGTVSRVQSKSRRNSRSDNWEKSGFMKRSESRVRGEDEAKENDFGQSLQDE